MFRTVCDRPTLWEHLLPEEAKVMPPELAAADVLLDDPRFFEPFRAFFDPVWGRPSIPIETYLRLMFLKYRRVARHWTRSVCRGGRWTSTLSHPRQ